MFELDLRAGELRKQGVKIKLQEQPFQILAMLLEHPGQLVTREELRGRLWPSDTFVAPAVLTFAIGYGERTVDRTGLPF